MKSPLRELADGAEKKAIGWIGAAGIDNERQHSSCQRLHTTHPSTGELLVPSHLALRWFTTHCALGHNVTCGRKRIFEYPFLANMRSIPFSGNQRAVEVRQPDNHITRPQLARGVSGFRHSNIT
jgi:hypothetical protein